MAYEVLSIGDAEMLYNTFQGAAMIFGNGSLTKLIRAGATLGVLLVSINYLTNQEFPLRYSLIGLIAYLVLFVPKDTVVIEDVYTGQVRTVANVPLGIAAPMSIISTMGVKMTTMFETAFSTPSEASLLENGYLNALKTMMKLQNLALGTAGSDGDLSGSVGETIDAYLEQCVMLDLELNGSDHEVTKESLLKSTGLLDAIKTSFVNVDILVKLPSSPLQGEQKSCKDAYTALTSYLRGQDFVDQMDRYVSGVLGTTDASVRASERIDQAKAALNIAGQDSQTYMENALLKSYLEDGRAAFIHRPAKEQLKQQWATEQTMFNEIARPLMAFVEMFTVAISPIVAFLTTLGPIGMTMMVRYVQLMLWISLWGPLMAVCNMYITVVTTRALDAVANYAGSNGTGLDAMVMHDQVFETIETWLATGSMLASSVPALALMIVYGGSVAATNLSGKMTSAASSSVKTGATSPDPIKIDAPMTLGSKSEYSPNTGPKKSGMADTTFSTSSTFGRATQSATASLRSASSSASQTLSSSLQTSQKSGTTTSDGSSIMSALSNSTAESDRWASSTGRTIADKVGRTEAEKEAIATGVSSAISAGLSTGMGIQSSSIGASGNAQLQSQVGMDAAKSKELSDAVQNVWNREYSGSTQVQKMQQSAQQHQDQTYFGSEEMKGHAEQYLSQLQAVSQASETFSQTASMQDSSGKSLSMSYQDLARRLNNSGAIVDINLENQAIAESMGAEAYQKLSDDAQYEINRSSASGIFGGDRDALAGFLKLNQANPIKAAEIVNKALMPTSSDSGVEIKATQFQNDQKGIKGIMGDQSADSIKSLASDWNESQDGYGDNYDNKSTQAGRGPTIEKAELAGDRQTKRGNNDSESEDGDGDHKTAMKHQTPHASEHQAHGTKTSHTAEPKQASINHATGNKHGSGHTAEEHQGHGTKTSHTAEPKQASINHAAGNKLDSGRASDIKQDSKQIKRVNLSNESDSRKAEIDTVLKGGKLGKADDVRQQIENGGKIDNSKDMSGMAGRAFRNEGSLLYDSTVTPVANTAKSAMTGLREGIETAEDYIDNAVSGALSNLSDKQPVKPSNASDNDLPPIPKK